MTWCRRRHLLVALVTRRIDESAAGGRLVRRCRCRAVVFRRRRAGGAENVLLAAGEQACGKQFQPHARRRGAGHCAERVVDRVGDCRQRAQAKGLRLPVQVIDVFDGGIIAEHAFRTFAAQGEYQEVAYAGQEVFHETSWFETADDDFLDDTVQLFAVTVDDGVDRLADQGVRGESE